VTWMRPCAARPQIADVMDDLQCEDLFSDWAPPRRGYEELVDIPADHATADCVDSQHPPANALTTESTYFCAEPPTKASRWHANLGSELVEVTSVTIKWVEEGGKFYLPEKFEVQISAALQPGTQASDWVSVYSFTAPLKVAKDALVHRVALDGVPLRHVRVVSTGYCAGNPGSHRLAGVHVRRKDSAIHRSMQATLKDLTALFTSEAALATPSVAPHALRGLMGLMHASGSLAVLLRLVHAMLRWSGDTVSQAATNAAKKLMHTLGPYVDESIENVLSDSVESMNQRQAGALVAAGCFVSLSAFSFSPACDLLRACAATFDASTMSSGMSLSDGDMVVRSGSGSSNRVVYVNQGFSSVRDLWALIFVEMVLSERAVRAKHLGRFWL